MSMGKEALLQKLREHMVMAEPALICIEISWLFAGKVTLPFFTFGRKSFSAMRKVIISNEEIELVLRKQDYLSWVLRNVNLCCYFSCIDYESELRD